jgi:uncharacterized protein YraI
MYGGVRVAVAALVGVLAGIPLNTAALAGGPVATAKTDGTPLNARSGPGMSYRLVAKISNGSRLAVACQVQGQMINGWVRRTDLWDRLTNGQYVSDAYVRWTPSRPALKSCPRPGATVQSGGTGLNVRAGASTRYRKLGTLPDGTRLTVQCQVYGQTISGTARRTAVWDRLPGNRYVSDAYVLWTPDRPSMLKWCGQQPPARFGNSAQFIAWVGSPAKQSSRTYKVPASVTIAQAILESGWGRSDLSRVDHNYFGIKCFGTPGAIAIGCRAYPTTECNGKKCYRTTAQFRVYRGPADSFADHGRFLVVNPRYRKAFSYTRDPNRFAIEIHKAGYATSPTYARNLINLMKRYNLYRFDR